MHPCRCCHPLVDRGLRGHVPAHPECITPHIRFLFIALRFRLGFPPHPASRRRTFPSASLRLYKPGTGTFTQLDSCHARHTRVNSPALRGFMRKVRWNDGLGITTLPPQYTTTQSGQCLLVALRHVHVPRNERAPTMTVLRRCVSEQEH